MNRKGFLKRTATLATSELVIGPLFKETRCLELAQPIENEADRSIESLMLISTGESFY